MIEKNRLANIRLERFDLDFIESFKSLGRPFPDARAKASGKICFFRETPARMVENLKNFQLILL